MTINDPRPKPKAKPGSMTYLYRSKPAATMSELVQQVQETLQPGREGPRPNPDPNADPQCKLCGGTGWKPSQQFSGRYFICSCVVKNMDSFIQARAPQTDYTKIGLTQMELDELDWSNIIDDQKISDAGKLIKPVKDLFKQGHGMLFIWGDYGQGKSLIEKIVVALAFRQGMTAAYSDLSAALDNIRLSFDEQHQSTALLQRMDWWIERKVLCIDELSRINETEWARERVFQLLDRRYQRAIRNEALTIIVSNETIGDISGYMKSRIQDRRLWITINGKEQPPIIHVNGKDGRQAMPKNYQF